MLFPHKINKISLSADALNTGYRNLQMILKWKCSVIRMYITYPCPYFAKCVLEKDKEKRLLLSFRQMFVMEE